MNSFNIYKNWLELSFYNAETNFSKINEEIIKMEGMSGTKTRHFYNNLMNFKDARYLEIGTWKGSSVCSAMYKNNCKNIICIDNWSQFNGPKDEFINNFNKFKGTNNASFIEDDCFNIDISNFPKFNIFLYDGEHSFESHYKALLHYYDCLDNIFIFIVDDWNWSDVREGTYKAIEDLNLIKLYEKEIRLTWDNSCTSEPELSLTWWNGICVFILQKPVISWNIDYKSNTSILCEIGKKYDTDKSSKRKNVSDIRHCHPYTLFYDTIFKNKKDENLIIGELGILEGSSLLMWNEYFKNSQIYGFDNNYNFLNNFKNNYNTDRIILEYIDVKCEENIKKKFKLLNIQFDVIIEDSTHLFEDQIKVIKSVYEYLKPGGLLIIEDIFKKYSENDYIISLKDILHHFQDYYFISLDHENRNSTGWDNDKLFILIKGGSEPIFKTNNKMTIITPSYRINNLIKLEKSINFDYVDEWIIIYDGNKIQENPNIFKNNKNSNKIKEYLYIGEGISGNPQRNYALNIVNNSNNLLYYLDDDNVIHNNLFRLLDIIDKNKLITFNQHKGLKGNNITVNFIDTAMMLINYNLCNNIRWILDKYEADGYYIMNCYENNKDNYIYVNNDLCYYNKIC